MVVIKHTNSLKKSEKFDAIVEKAGKVDANYAAQIRRILQPAWRIQEKI